MELSLNFVITLPTASSTSVREYILVGGYFSSISIKMDRGNGTAADENQTPNHRNPAKRKMYPIIRIIYKPKTTLYCCNLQTLVKNSLH
jgi:hypothetical protein